MIKLRVFLPMCLSLSQITAMSTPDNTDTHPSSNVSVDVCCTEDNEMSTNYWPELPSTAVPGVFPVPRRPETPSAEP